MSFFLNSYIFGGKKQTITPFSSIPLKDINTVFTITKPTASSGLPVNVSILSGPATITSQTSTTVTITTNSTIGIKDLVTLAADQPGDSVWAEADQITTSFMVIDFAFHSFTINIDTNLT